MAPRRWLEILLPTPERLELNLIELNRTHLTVCATRQTKAMMQKQGTDPLDFEAVKKVLQHLTLNP